MGLVLSSAHCFRYRNDALWLTISTAGWIIGYLVESQHFKLPQASATWIYLIPQLMLVLLTLFGYPTSITQLYISTLLGYSLATNFQQGVYAVMRIIISWMLSLSAGFLSSMFLWKLLQKVVKPINIARALVAMRVLSLIYVFLLSYVLGGNVLGAIVSLLGGGRLDTHYVVCTAIIVSVYLSSSAAISSGLIRVLFPARYLTSLIPYTVTVTLTQVANLLGLPVVASLVMFSSILGMGMASELKILNRRRALKYILTAYAGPFAASTLLSYAVAHIIIL